MPATYLIPILLTAGAAAFGYLAGEPAASVVVLTAAVAFCTWRGGSGPGITSAVTATILLPFTSSIADPMPIAVFAVAAALIVVTTQASRSSWRHFGGIEVRGDQVVAAMGLPLLAAIIYLNLSDVVARRTAIPSLLQPLIALLIFAVIAWWREFRPRTVAATPVALLAIVYCSVLFVRSAWAADLSSADERIGETVRGIIILVVVAALAVSWTVVRRSMAAFALGGGLLGALTLIQTATGRFDFDFFGLARTDYGTIYGSVRDVRAAGPVGDPNFYGQILVIAFPLAAFLAWSSERKSQRLLYFGAAALVAIGTVLTYSRGAMLALAITTVLTIVLLKVRLVYVIALAILAVLVAPPNMTRRLLTLDGSESVVAGVERDSSLDRRILDASTAAMMFADRPFFGAGTGNFSRYYGPYANQVGSSARQYDIIEPRQYPHSLYLELAAETGVVGLVSFGAMIAAAFLMLSRARVELVARARPDAVLLVTGIAVAITGYLLSSIFLHGAFQRYLWVLLGLVAAVGRLARSGDAAVRPAETS